MTEFLASIGGWKTIIGAGLSIAAALLTWYIKRKEIWPFKPRLKKVLDEGKKFDDKIDNELEKKDYAAYLDDCDAVLDERERLRQQEAHDDKADK